MARSVPPHTGTHPHCSLDCSLQGQQSEPTAGTAPGMGRCRTVPKPPLVLTAHSQCHWGHLPASSESSAKPQSSSPLQTCARGMQRPLAQRNSGGAQGGVGSRAHPSHPRSQTNHHSGHPRARTARQRSGVGAGRSAGHRPHPSRPRSRPRCRRAMRPARSARQSGTGTPSQGSGAVLGRALPWARIATALRCMSCRAAAVRMGCR